MFFPAIFPFPSCFLQPPGWSSAIRAIKKGPFRSLFSRMGAFAGWLHHPAHARSYYENVCHFHHVIFLPPPRHWVNPLFAPPENGRESDICPLILLHFEGADKEPVNSNDRRVAPETVEVGL
ncbi:MAG: hypothetical protein CML31_01785 [Rhizobiales bacterium]|nr:hypothetical protein [Hyphomicrobiales bacterium]